MLGSYALFHDSFFRLNSELNQQQEAQVDVLEKRRRPHLRSHLLRLRSIEVKISDNESILYGLIFIVLLGLILFNLWFAATHMETTSGTIFSIISYSWEFVESALALPIVLQSWSRLSEITQRINQSQDAQS
jgi:NADH:ubiquinone oxidoreductase subunit K